MTPTGERVETALAKLDAAEKHDGIQPGTYLWAWAEAQRDLVRALYGLETRREEVDQGTVTATKALLETSAETVRQQVEAMKLEARKIDRYIEQSKITLGKQTDETIQSLADKFTDKMRDVMVVRARAWSRTSYLQTAGALAVVGFLMFGGGYWAAASRPGNGAPSDFIQQCFSSLRRDPTTRRVFCDVEIATRR